MLVKVPGIANGPLVDKKERQNRRGQCNNKIGNENVTKVYLHHHTGNMTLYNFRSTLKIIFLSRFTLLRKYLYDNKNYISSKS